jgi:selenocysteine lyase/cysteine desulfurase
VQGVTVQDLGRKKCGIVTFQKQGETAGQLAARLLEKKINVSITDIFSARIDFTERGLDELVRASLHYFNTENEIDRFVEAVKN